MLANADLQICFLGKPVLSSVVLQILLNLSGYYLGLLFVLEILLFVYKVKLNCIMGNYVLQGVYKVWTHRMVEYFWYKVLFLLFILFK